MRTHQDIDRRSLDMVRRIVAKIDADPERRGLAEERMTELDPTSVAQIRLRLRSLVTE